MDPALASRGGPRARSLACVSRSPEPARHWSASSSRCSSHTIARVAAAAATAACEVITSLDVYFSWLWLYIFRCAGPFGCRSVRSFRLRRSLRCSREPVNRAAAGAGNRRASFCARRTWPASERPEKSSRLMAGPSDRKWQLACGAAAAAAAAGHSLAAARRPSLSPYFPPHHLRPLLLPQPLLSTLLLAGCCCCCCCGCLNWLLARKWRRLSGGCSVGLCL